MTLIAFGVNHNTATVELREKFSRIVSTSHFLEHVNVTDSVHECVVLSTCNRVEIYAVVPNDMDGSHFFENFQLNELKPFRENFYTYASEEVVHHLFRVVSSLDSMILGENQILSQTRAAYQVCVERVWTGAILRRLFERAFKLAKEVRTHTAISEGAVSIGRAGVDLAQQVLGDLSSVAALIIGAGEHGQLVANNMKNQGLINITIANRTVERAEEFASQIQGSYCGLDNIIEVIEQVDVVVSSVGGGEIIVDKDMVRNLMRSRKYKPLVFIDLSVPRVFDVALHELDDVYLFDVDDLKGLTDHGESLRRTEAVVVEEMVQDATIDCWRLLHADQHNRTIGQVFQNASVLCCKELERLKSQANFSDEQIHLIHRSMESLVRKIYHHPVQHVHALANDDKINEIQNVMDILLGSKSTEENDA